MRIVRFERAGKDRFGILRGDFVVPLAAPPFEGIRASNETIPFDEIRLLPPVLPPNILAIGLNYRGHAAEIGSPLPDHPVVFLKATTALAGPGDDILLPREAPREVDYEAELVVVIGRDAKNISEAEAPGHILGYACGNDISARDCQLRLDKQWARGKSFDTFAPIGPWIETDFDPEGAAICLRRNGQVMQASSTSDMIVPPRALVSYLSRQTTLLPGTAIFTGTPAGVGVGRTPPVFLREGDTLEVEIAGIGVLRNGVRSES